MNGQGQFLVVSSKCIGDFYQIRIFDGMSFFSITSPIDFQLESLIKIDSDKINSETINQENKNKKETLLKKLQNRVKPFTHPAYIQDECLKKLIPKIDEVAEFIKKNVVFNRPIFLRYNADTDGICSALFIKNAIQSFSKENGITPVFIEVSSPPAIYTKPQSINEMKYFEEMNLQPLCILLDHAANSESVAALNHIKSLSFPIVIVDHHPPDNSIQKITDYFISPFSVEVFDSKYTTGLLSYEISKSICNFADEKMLDYSLLADASTFAKTKDYTFPLAIDYYAQTNSKATLDDYSQIISLPEYAQKLFSIANKTLHELADIAWEKSEFIKENDYFFVVTDLNGIIKKRTFPSKGMVINLVQKKAESESSNLSVVSFCYVGDSIGLRANSLAIQNGFDANLLIISLKEKFPRLIRSGGGHKGAASLLIFDEADRLRLREIVIQFAKEML